jgi:hypothetical protein
MTNEHSISPLRHRMIDDMTLRKLSPRTQAAYLRAVIKFACFFGQSPDLASPEDLRRFQLHLVETGVSPTTINATLTGLGFLFGVTLERPDTLKRTSRVRQPQCHASSASRKWRACWPAPTTPSTGPHWRCPMAPACGPAKWCS